MKKLKIILSALAVLILVVGGYVLYELKFKNYEVADPKIDSIVEEAFEVELENGMKLVIKDGNVETVASSGASSPTEQNEDNPSDTNTNDKDIDTNGENSDTSVSDGANQIANNTTTDNGSSGSNSYNGTNTTTDHVTVATIKNKYDTTFNLLETQTKNRLNSLISEAKAEYMAKKNNGEKISYGYFYRKYMDAATSLEQSITSAVNAVAKLVEAELKANGYNPEHAQTYVEHYEKTKEELRSELMRKFLNN